MTVSDFNKELQCNLEAVKSGTITDLEYSSRVVKVINSMVASLRNSENSRLSTFNDYEKSVIIEVCNRYRIPPLHLLSDIREKPIPEARNVCFYLFREKGYTFRKIGTLFNRDHATVIFGKNRIVQLLQIKDPLVTSLINQMI